MSSRYSSLFSPTMRIRESTLQERSSSAKTPELSMASAARRSGASMPVKRASMP